MCHRRERGREGERADRWRGDAQSGRYGSSPKRAWRFVSSLCMVTTFVGPASRGNSVAIYATCLNLQAEDRVHNSIIKLRHF